MKRHLGHPAMKAQVYLKFPEFYFHSEKSTLLRFLIFHFIEMITNENIAFQWRHHGNRKSRA